MLPLLIGNEKFRQAVVMYKLGLGRHLNRPEKFALTGACRCRRQIANERKRTKEQAEQIEHRLLNVDEGTEVRRIQG